MNDDDHHEARGAMLHRGIVEQRQEDMVRQMFKDEEEINRLRADVEKLTRERNEARKNAVEWLANERYRAETAEREVERLTRERDALLKDRESYTDAFLRAEAAERERDELSEEMKLRRDEFAIYRQAAERRVEKLREALYDISYARPMFEGGVHLPSKGALEGCIGDMKALANAVLAETEKP